MLKKLSIIILFLFVFLSACRNENDPQKAFDDGDYELSFRLWKERAVEGNDIAQNYLGIHYYLGRGVNRDIKQAFHWYKKSAEAGNPDAQRNLGAIYESGDLGNRDFENAYIWLYASYKQGNTNAAKILESISGQLSPGRVRRLKQVSIQYVLNNIVDPENDDF
ncbi:MAG: sel1 repeat family protein [Proteobacteria bacterium]|nr:sel1 repeat family protein [Pseudomonadota bacterium]NOG59914.1 sel1 repeat family protein [Pseudomonadota bacterium]